MFAKLRHHEPPAGPGREGLPVVLPQLFQNRPRMSGITIDPSRPSEIDDAVWVRRDGTGHIVEISIAQPSAVIKPGDHLDLRARETMHSRYAGRKAIDPLLPKELSEIELSFLPGEKRLALTVAIPFIKNNRGSLEFGDATFSPTVLVSAQQFSYYSAASALQEGKHEHLEVLKQLREIAGTIYSRRTSNGAPGLPDGALGWLYDEEKRKIGVPSRLIDSYLIVTELMILANTAAAGYFARNELPGIFRNHMPLAGEGRYRASYGSAPHGHMGLKLPAYMHFTSPLRRYADLVNQQIFTAHINGEKLPWSTDELAGIAERANHVGNLGRPARGGRYSSRSISTGVLPRVNYHNFKIRELIAELRAADGQGEISNELGDEISRRIGHRGKAAELLCRTIFFNPGKSQVLSGLRAATLGKFERDPFLAAAVLPMFLRRCSAPIENDHVYEAHGAELPWQGSLAVKFPDGSVLESTALGRDRTEASVKTRQSLLKALLETKGPVLRGGG